jgi:hypothetical protein
MKLITTLLALSLVACVKPMPPKAETLDLPCPDALVALARTEIVCDMPKVMNVATDVCCTGIACTPKGYRHDLHVMCALSVAWENRCTETDVLLNTTSSICDCDAPVLPNENF